MQLIWYEKCGTCRKARKWLDEHEVKYELRDIKEQNPSLSEIKKWHKESGLPLRKLFNTSGKLYRDLDLKNRLSEMTEEEQLKLLSEDGMLVKRPIIVGNDKVLFGFRQEEYEGLI